MTRSHRHNVPAARDLRQRETKAERLLWRHLRDTNAAGLKVRRQHPVGTWVLDCCVPAVRLAIELDGTVHDKPDQAERDAFRSAMLAEAGYTILRIPNADVLADPAAVVARIAAAAAELGHEFPGQHAPRPPQRERGWG